MTEKKLEKLESETEKLEATEKTETERAQADGSAVSDSSPKSEGQTEGSGEDSHRGPSPADSERSKGEEPTGREDQEEELRGANDPDGGERAEGKSPKAKGPTEGKRAEEESPKAKGPTEGKRAEGESPKAKGPTEGDVSEAAGKREGEGAGGETQFRLEVRPSSGQLLFHWGGAILAITSAVIIYFANFWLPYRGVTFKGCPSICHYNSDCRVPDCGSEKVKLECYANKCSLPTGHGHFFTAVLVFFLGLGGLFWAALALFQSSVTIVIDNRGIYYKTLFSRVEIPWEQFLGISYRGVHTRLGKTLTLYSLVGEQGMFSFIKKGLPPETFAPRELDLSSFLLISPPSKKCDELIKAVEKFSGEKPQSEE